ncbi:TPA: hypothetical protein L4T69_005748 [Pseudomonas aeruginosa]|nr:hypothetical protein [Pseudomonas aeruginosa]QPZ63184.1 hypothetical protein I9X26_13215 [Pseudomonas aeruginosa]HBO3954673.1 hypothetical protein [Pseudomonas aeruginosa]
MVQLTLRRNQGTAGSQHPVSVVQRPDAPRRVELGLEYFGVEAHTQRHTLAFGSSHHVSEDFPLRRIVRGPAPLWGEQQRVQHRGHVATGARIVALAPGTADLLDFLEQDEIRQAQFVQVMCHDDTRKPHADDGDFMIDIGFANACRLTCVIDHVSQFP